MLWDGQKYRYNRGRQPSDSKTADLYRYVRLVPDDAAVSPGRAPLEGDAVQGGRAAGVGDGPLRHLLARQVLRAARLIAPAVRDVPGPDSGGGTVRCNKKLSGDYACYIVVFTYHFLTQLCKILTFMKVF